MFRGIMGKVWLANILLVTVVLAVAGFSLSELFQKYYIDQRGKELARDGQAIGGVLLGQDAAKVDEDLKLLATVVDTEIMLADREGIVRGCTGGGMGIGMRMRMGQRLDEETQRQLLAGQVVTQTGPHPWYDVSVLTVMVPLKEKGNVEGALFLTTPLAALEENLRQIRILTALGGVGAIILATILSFFISRLLTRPLLEMNTAALALAAGNFSDRVEVKTDDEIGLLGKSLNFLAGELDKTVSALSQERDKLDRILNSMSDGVVTFDREGHVIQANPTMTSLGLVVHPGANINDCCPVDQIRETWRQVMEEGTAIAADFPLGEKTIAFRMAPLHDKEGNVTGAVSLFQDVTRERKLEALRREFVGNVSHDLRTPLSLIQGYTEALQDGMAGSLDEEQNYLEIINNEAYRLRRLVDDLMELNRLEEGSLPINPTTLALGELLSGVAGKYRPMAREKGVELATSIEELPPVTADGDLLERVVINLLDNALQHTPAGGKVEIAAKVNSESSPGAKEIIVTISDTGAGIPPEDIPRLWERFYRGDKARSRGRDGGSGLGLTVVKSIVEAHGGTVWAENKEGVGAVFGFTLPVPGEKI